MTPKQGTETNPAPMPASKDIHFTGKRVSFEDFQGAMHPIYNFAYALDTRDWTLMRTSFDARVSVDTSATGTDVTGGMLTADEFIWNVKISETGFEGTELLFGNPQVMIDGATAFVRVAFYGEHVAAVAMGDNFFTIGGYQDWRLRREGESWLIDGFRLRPLWSKGNKDIMNIGVIRGAERLEVAGDPPPAGLLERLRW